MEEDEHPGGRVEKERMSAYVSIRQHTSAYERRGEWRLEMLSQGLVSADMRYCKSMRSLTCFSSTVCSLSGPVLRVLVIALPCFSSTVCGLSGPVI